MKDTNYKIDMIRIVLLSSLVIASHVAGFTPAPRSATPVRMKQMFNPDGAEASELEVVGDDEGEKSTDDPFDTYRPVANQQIIATKDIKIGSGAEVKSAGDQMIAVKFQTNLLDGKYNKQIKEFNVTKLSFKTGSQNIMSGLEEGVYGMKVGGVRKIRIPPNKAYGDTWYRGIVPPGSHLEFNCEVIEVAESPIEEARMRLENFGVERAGAWCC